MNLHERALMIAKKYREAEAELLSIIQEVDLAREFRAHGYPSLMAYAVGALGLSEAVAMNFIAVARKAIEAPALKRAIDEGRLGVAKARKITPVLTAENQELWVGRAIRWSQRMLECEVAREFPERAIPERMRFVAPERVELRMGLSPEMQEKLRRVQDLESQRLGRAATLEEALGAAVEFFLNAKDPVVRAQRVIAGRRKARLPVARQAGRVPAAERHRVILRDRGRCTYRDTQGNRCESRRWIDIHHVRPKSQGGADTAENLVTLCAAHHRIVHDR